MSSGIHSLGSALVMSLCLSAVAQNGRPSRWDGRPLSDKFSARALEKLEQISSFDGAPEHHREGSQMTMKQLYDSVSTLEDVARNGVELVTIGGLRGFLTDRLSNNEVRAQIFEQAWSDYKGKHPADQQTAEERSRIEKEVSAQPIFAEMKTREEACRAGLAAMLQAQKYAVVPACMQVKVESKGTPQ